MVIVEYVVAGMIAVVPNIVSTVLTSVSNGGQRVECGFASHKMWHNIRKVTVNIIKVMAVIIQVMEK